MFGKGTYTVGLLTHTMVNAARITEWLPKERKPVQHAQSMSERESNSFHPSGTNEVTVNEDLLDTSIPIRTDFMSQSKEGGNLNSDIMSGFMILIAKSASHEINHPVLYFQASI